MRTIVYALLSLFLSIIISSCGRSFKEAEVKSYVLGSSEANPQVQATLQSLVQTYNAQAGFQALSFSRDLNAVNSPITFVRGLNSSDGKVGYGQWLAEITEEGVNADMEGRSPERKTVYSMRIELDWKYFTDNMNGTAAGTYELQKLLYHEIGHGLQMDHDTDSTSMMYPEINGTKDFDAYFHRVRAYFGH